MTKTVIVRYGEIALKSEPVRRRFERRLIENIKLSLKGLDYKLRRERGRIFTETRRPRAVIERLVKTPGIVSLSPSLRTNATIDSITSAVVREAKKILSPGMTFAIRTSRVGEHQFSSKDVNVSAGSAVLAEVKGVRVNLSTPKRKIFVDVRGEDAYVFTEIADGVGGLPVGTQGSVVALFSGSLNSSVSSYLMMKRGCMLHPIFFDPRPHADGQVRKYAIGAARKLVGFYPKLELRIFPFGKIFQAIGGLAQGMENLLQKRAMIRAAEVIAGKLGGVAIVGDEDLEKIAEGGVEILGAIDDTCELPVLRPLAGMIKEDIEKIANKIGILDPSFRTAKIYPPPSHSTALKLEEISEIEGGLNIDALIESALSRIKIIKLRRGAWT